MWFNSRFLINWLFFWEMSKNNQKYWKITLTYFQKIKNKHQKLQKKRENKN